jgi:hypothetical protein
VVRVWGLWIKSDAVESCGVVVCSIPATLVAMEMAMEKIAAQAIDCSSSRLVHRI